MMQKEFEDRAKFNVSAECYHKLIEPKYNTQNMDKDTWVKDWVKNGGIQKAYDWEVANRKTAEEKTKNTEREKAAATEQYKELAESLIEKGEQYGDTAMLEKAKGLLGTRRYLRFKLGRGMQLRKDEVQFIIELLK